MLRDPALIPLSHQHQHALALCVKIDRAQIASDAELAEWRAEVTRLYEQEIRFHFDAEERVLFPAVEHFDSLQRLVYELRREHGHLRAEIATAAEGAMTADALKAFAQHLSAHVRREERDLFETMQSLLSHDQLARLGAAIDQDFKDSGMPGASCALRPARDPGC